jgi:hypothetical protein
LLVSTMSFAASSRNRQKFSNQPISLACVLARCIRLR